MDKVRYGLVGYKFMGKAHSNALARIGMFMEPDFLVDRQVLCGRDPAWLADAARKFGWNDTETDWRKLVARPDVDAIDITAPSDAHAAIALEAAACGKHIFCEKPLALNLADGRAMLEAARKNGVKHQIGFNFRFAPAVQLAKKLISEGRLGRIFHFRGLYLQDWIIDPSFPLVWRLDKKVCGSGSHGDLGAHLIDLSRFLLGDIDRVVGHSKTFVTERPRVEKMSGLSGKASADAPMGKVEVDDATLFLCEFQNGALGSFEATRFAQGHRNAMSFEINGSKGSLRFEVERINELQYYNADDEDWIQGFRTIQCTEGGHPYMQAWWPAGHPIGYEHTFVHELYEFSKSIVHDLPTSPDFAEGVACSQVLEAVDLSIQHRAWVDVASL
jgi:predicted dehydrogenase